MIQSSRKILQFIVIVLILLFIIAGSFYLIMGGKDLGISKNRVEVIYVQGIMLTGSVPTGFGVATSEDIVKSLKDANEDEGVKAISYTHLRAHETRHDLVCRLLLEKKKK